MTESALERAAKAICDDGWDDGFGVTSLDTELCESMTAEKRVDFMRFLANVAITAFLDPEDEAMQEAVARSIMALDLDDATGDWTNYRLRAAAAIAALTPLAVAAPTSCAASAAK